MATETLTGKQKAAMLLMSLDVTTATELLKGFDPKVVEDLAVELTYLDAAGYRNNQASEAVATEFFETLTHKRSGSSPFHSFLDEMLRNTLGADRADRVQGQIHELLKKRDPFMTIRSADNKLLARILGTEHPQAVAVILSELTPKRSSELLGLLGEGVRLSAISRMTSIGSVTPEAKARIAELISAKIEAALAPKSGAQGAMLAVAGAMAEESEGGSNESLRKVAVILRNLDRELRDSVLDSVRAKDRNTVDTVMNLMVTWDDLPMVDERSIQSALRGLDERKLALALFQAEPAVSKKIKSGISERAAAMVDEEAGLLSKPKPKEIDEAREQILQRLREMNRNGEVAFEEA